MFLFIMKTQEHPQRIVHSVIVNKKIKAIIKDNQDFMKISDAQNLIFYSLSECNELIDQYAKENNNNQYAPAYSIHSSKTNIIESYNQLDKKHQIIKLQMLTKKWFICYFSLL